MEIPFTGSFETFFQALEADFFDQELQRVRAPQCVAMETKPSGAGVV